MELTVERPGPTGADTAGEDGLGGGGRCWRCSRFSDLGMGLGQ